MSVSCVNAKYKYCVDSPKPVARLITAILKRLAYNAILYCYPSFFHTSFSMSESTVAADQSSYQALISSLYTAQQVTELDNLVIAHQGISASTLMKRAGREAFEYLFDRWPNTVALHIFCGSGNNGGECYGIAALAKQRNIRVRPWSIGEPAVKTPAARARDAAT